MNQFTLSIVSRMLCSFLSGQIGASQRRFVILRSSLLSQDIEASEILPSGLQPYYVIVLEKDLGDSQWEAS